MAQNLSASMGQMPTPAVPPKPKATTFLDKARAPLMVLLALVLSFLYMGPLHIYLPVANLLLMVISIEVALAFPALAGKTDPSSSPLGMFASVAAAAAGQQENGAVANAIERLLNSFGFLVKFYGVVTQMWRDISVFVFVLVCACTVMAHPAVDTLLWDV
jgi:hypothetical protein